MTRSQVGPAAHSVRSGHLTLLLVDDSRIFAEVLAGRMRADSSVADVQIACSLTEARRSLRGSRPDLVLLDLHVGAEAGLDLLPDVQRMPRPPRVLMLSGDESLEEVIRALDADADGWVSKTAAFETLMSAVIEVARGDMYLPPRVLGPVLRRLLTRSRADESFLDTITARQLEVLRCLVAGMSRLECAGRLHLSVNTVRTHVQTLMKRADVHSTLALAVIARDLGVRGIDEDDRRRVPAQRSPV